MQKHRCMYHTCLHSLRMRILKQPTNFIILYILLFLTATTSQFCHQFICNVNSKICLSQHCNVVQFSLRSCYGWSVCERTNSSWHHILLLFIRFFKRHCQCKQPQNSPTNFKNPFKAKVTNSQTMLVCSQSLDWTTHWTTLCRWRHCFLTDQLWLMTRIREEEDWTGAVFMPSVAELYASIVREMTDNSP